jgi:hypothetical protein
MTSPPYDVIGVQTEDDAANLRAALEAVAGRGLPAASPPSPSVIVMPRPSGASPSVP